MQNLPMGTMFSCMIGQRREDIQVIEDIDATFSDRVAGNFGTECAGVTLVCLVRDVAGWGSERARSVSGLVGEVVLGDDRLVDLDDLFLEKRRPMAMLLHLIELGYVVDDGRG